MSRNQSSKTSTAKAITLIEALQVIATELTDKVVVERDGVPTEINRLAYAQKRVLNGIAYSTALTLQRTQQDLDAAKQKVVIAARSHRGDELSELALNRAVDWAERLELQEATLSNLMTLASEVYTQHTGESFEPPVARPTQQREFSTQAMERAKRFAIGSREVPQGGGVEAA